MFDKPSFGVIDAADQLPKKCMFCPAWRHCFCGALTPRELEGFAQIAVTRKFESGAQILKAGDEIDYFANIVSGVLKISTLLPDGRQQILALQFAGDFFGLNSYGEGDRFVMAVTPVEFCLFPKRTFEAVSLNTSRAQQLLYMRALDELNSAREWMVLLGRKTAQERLASFLKMLAQRSASTLEAVKRPRRSDGITIEIPLSRTDIADFLGLTIETVSREFGKMRDDGLIVINAKRLIAIPDMGALAAASGDA